MSKPLKQPQTEDYGVWDFDAVKSVSVDLDSGDFETAGQLVSWLCADPRIASCNVSRGAAVLQDARLVVTAPEKWKDQLREDIGICIPADTVCQLLTWQRMMMCSLAQIIWHFEGQENGPEVGPIVQPWNLQFLRQSRETKGWEIKEGDSSSLLMPSGRAFGQQWKPIKIGADSSGEVNWIFMGREVNPNPWHELGVGWKVLGPLRVGGVNALVWWMRNAMHGSISPILARTEGMDPPSKARFLADLADLGQTLWIECPFLGENQRPALERIASEPLDYKSTADLKKEVDKLMSEFLLGQSTSTRMESAGSYGAVEVLLNEVSGKMLSLELARLARSLVVNWLPIWRHWRKVPEGVPISFGWTVSSLKDVERRAAALSGLAKAVKDWPGCEAEAIKIMEEL